MNIGKSSLFVVASLTLAISNHPVSASPLVVDANNRVIGFYLGANQSGGCGSGNCGDTESAVTQSGLRFSFLRRNGRVLQPPGGPGYTEGQGTIRFASADCTGQAYMVVDSQSLPTAGSIFLGTAPYEPAPGVPQAVDPLEYYVLPQELPTVQQVLIRSYWIYTHPQNQRICASDNATRSAIPVNLNDPNVTGFPKEGLNKSLV